MDKKNSIISSKDIMILKQLLEDGRKSSASISKEIDLGREIVNYRIKRLIKENLIVKFVPKINETIINYKEYIILLKLNLEDEVSKEEFVKDAIGNKYLIWFIKSKGGWDIVIRLYAHNIDEFKDKLSEILDSFSEVLASYYTIISSTEIKEDEKRVLIEEVFKEVPKKDFKEIKKTHNNEFLRIDDKDKEILKLLDENARFQYKEIAEKLDVSSDTIKYRIEKLRELQIIENFQPIINYSKLGFQQYAGILKFGYLNSKEEEKIENFFKKCKSIVHAIKNLNREEYFINIVCDNDNEIENIKKNIVSLFNGKEPNLDIFELN
jgi:Lrp/AsnC family leucine-responsive transcriptional regulator